MSEPIIFISRNRVKAGRNDEFRKHYQDSIPAIFDSKPETYAQLGYESENNEEIEFVVIRLFPSADALDLQIQGANERSRKTYEFIEPISIEIFGTPNPTTLEKNEKDRRLGYWGEHQSKLCRWVYPAVKHARRSGQWLCSLNLPR